MSISIVQPNLDFDHSSPFGAFREIHFAWQAKRCSGRMDEVVSKIVPVTQAIFLPWARVS